MNRAEALRALGLGSDATQADIKAAYREMAQILHPDRFASNKKLQDRATEQFKNLQEAYDYLVSGKGSRGAGGSGSSAASDRDARLAGIKAARVQLVAERDAAADARRNALAMTVGGGIVALVLWRVTRGLLRTVCAIATAVAVWGIASLVSSQRTIRVLDDNLKKLAREQRDLENCGEE